MPCALDKFISSLIHDQPGCSSSMTIICDNAKVSAKQSRRTVPSRSRSLPINRWDAPARFQSEPVGRPLTPVLLLEQGQGALSRWESLTRNEKASTKGTSDTLILPTRRSAAFDKYSSLDSPAHTRPDIYKTTSKSLPLSLLSLPY
jgi:hypothetical protein